MITKIISGGQIGVDVAGLKVAMDLGIDTGGMVPNGWKTLIGPKPSLAKLGLHEHPTSSNYRDRTEWNVQNSDGTIIFATNFKSSGTKLTISLCRKYKKPYFLIDLNDIDSGFIFDVFNFFDQDIKVLNVAGNSGYKNKTTKFLYNKTRELLYNYISKYNE